MSGSIVARNVVKTFATPNGPLRVIDDVSLDVADGEFVALVGPSGCGKSTLLDILAGFDRPDHGTVAIDGKPVAAPERSRILIPQQPSVFPWISARRNLTLIQGDEVPESEQRRLALHYLHLVGLEGFDRAYPYQMSGGMVKRLELARALVVKPDVLFMDEPFGALDALTRMKLQTELLRILTRERHTVILVTHDVHEAIYLADRIVVLSPRPAQVRKIVEITAPRPRQLVGGDITRLKAVVLEELGVPPDGSFADEAVLGVNEAK
jgi:ABC-type nitrate/sulfonate/bicarbonate transport system ATPase subunit